MILKLRLGKWRLTITFAPVIDVVGVNSLLPDGNHILMWDFDDVPLEDVQGALFAVQQEYELPTIYILETMPNHNYIAYCFRRTSWREAVEIVAWTLNVCWNFFKWGVFRHRFTLRVGPKCGRIPKIVSVLLGYAPEDAFVEELASWVKYETLPDWHRIKILKFGEDICQEKQHTKVRNKNTKNGLAA